MSLFKSKKSRKTSSAPRELMTRNTHFVITEAYKRLRTNLLFMLSGNKKVIAFTSTMPSEGKTTNCLNIAIAFAETGNKILVIDMDMRKPRVHTSFDFDLSPGLSDALISPDKKPNIKATDRENLFVLTAGTKPPAPPELLMTSEFETLLNALREEYDYIFIDTPPVHIVSDLSVVANKFDGVVYVVREKTVPLRTLKKSIEQLENVQAHVLGFIFNDSEKSSLFAKYAYRYKYSYKYGYRYGSYGFRYGYTYGYEDSTDENGETVRIKTKKKIRKENK